MIYHVGCGLFGKIYAGRLNKQNMWVSKSDVTQEVLDCAFEYLYTNRKEVKCNVNGKKLAMRIVPDTEESEV